MFNQLEGVVKVFFKEKGYGFIECESLGNVFFHISQVDPAISENIHINDNVSFEAERSRKKPGTYTAKNVMAM